MRLTVIFFFLCLLSCKQKLSNIQFPQGGYDYLTTPNHYVDFYYAPAKDSMAKEDSISTAFYTYHFYKSFGEKNLSLRPSSAPTFRFVYGDALGTVPEVVVTLTENQIVIKKRKAGNPFPVLDDKVLSDTERYYLNLMRSFYLFSRGQHYSEKLNRRLDSILKQNPKLLDSRYHVFLLNKCVRKQEGFSYTLTTQHITNATFNRIVDSVNNSGFWKLPFNVKCFHPPMDGDFFCLEAATPQKYNVVCGSTCESPALKFIMACQVLTKEANLTKELRF